MTRNSSKQPRKAARKGYVIGWKASEYISRVEGLKFSDEMIRQFNSFDANDTPADVRRDILMRQFGANVP